MQTQANDDEDTNDEDVVDYDIAQPPVGTVLLSPPLNPPDPFPVEGTLYVITSYS